MFLGFRPDTRSLFSQSRKFFLPIKNKIHFFLVAFATDFYSQARWRGQPQSACEKIVNMFEKLPAARMDKGESSSIQRLIADARELHSKETLNDASRRFPSYLRVPGNFFARLKAELYWGAVRLLLGCCRRFPTARPCVAFL